MLTYNSWSPENSDFGYGWSNSLVRSLRATLVTAGDGAVYRYSDKDASGQFLPPAGAVNALVQHGDGSYTETQPDGFQMHYDTTGSLTQFESAAGDLWTLSYSGGRWWRVGRSRSIAEPRLAYDGSGKIQRVVDSYNRITSFTVDGSGDLATMTTPELCQTQMRYDANHQLTAYIDPGGQSDLLHATTRSIAGWSPSELPTDAAPATPGKTGPRRSSRTRRAIGRPSPTIGLATSRR